jgi:adenylate kinase
MQIVMLGAPGGGKGTQASMLAQRLNVPHLVSGDLFRTHQKEGTVLGLQVAEFMDKGLLVPDDITISMMLKKVLSNCDCGGFVLDGFPRNVHQAKELENGLASRSMDVDRAILIEVSEKEILSRLETRLVCPQCNAVYNASTKPSAMAGICDNCCVALQRRTDDQKSAIKNRLASYKEEISPVLAFYECRGKLEKVDGLGEVGTVSFRIAQSFNG